MKWEVRTMAFGTSCFNGTLYRKSMARFWPLWGLWGLIWMFLIPLRMLNNYFEILRWNGTMGEARQSIYQDAQRLGELLNPGVWLACVFGVLAAMAVFGYLYSTRSACMMHALPLRRESLFTTQYLAGLSFLLLPLAAVGVITLAAELILIPSYNWGATIPTLGTVLLVQAGVCLFFFSFASFCAMFTGHILALPSFYAILNALVFVIYYLVTLLLRQFFYGYSGSFNSFWVTCCTPVYALSEACRWEMSPIESMDASVDLNRWHLASPTMVAVYAGVGVVFALLALSVYRRRHVESAGDVVSVKLVRPIFKYGVALCAGLCLGVFTASFFSWRNDPPTGLIICVLLWTAVGYFIAEMLLKKSFRVWKAWKGGVAAVAVMGLLCAVCVFDLFGVETRVPSVDSVEKVYFYGDIGYPYDDGRLRFDNTSDPRLIELVTQLHQAAVNEKGRAEQVGGDDYIYFNIDYTLKNGSTISRQYSSIPVYEDELHDLDTVTGCAQRMLEDRELIEQMYNFDYYEQGQLTQTYLLDVWQEKEEYFGTLFLEEQSPADLRKLWEAVRQDFEEGNIGVHSLFADPHQGDMNPKLEFTWTFETDSPRTTSDQEGSRSILQESVTIAVAPQATHTLACLEEMGLPNEGYQLFHP